MKHSVQTKRVPREDEIVLDPIREAVGVVVGEAVKPDGQRLAILRVADGTEIESLPFSDLVKPTLEQVKMFEAAAANSR
jgi:hypothetical protein